MPSKYLHRRIKHNLRWEAAKWWLRLHPGVQVIAIGGSVGKTTTKDLTAAVLSQAFPIVKSRANFDPIFNLPQTALRIRGQEKFVAEMGIDGPGQMTKYLELLTPDVAILTELSLEHTDAEHLGSLEQAIAEEWKLIESLPENGLAILNGDNPYIREQAKSVSVERWFYGFKPENDIQIVRAKQSIEGHRANLSIALTGRITGSFSAPLLGKHNSLSMAASIAAGVHLGVDPADIQAGLKAAVGPEHRLEVKPVEWGIVIDDTYNSSPVAAKAAIDVLVELGQAAGVLVLGDMLELGDYATAAHREVGAYAATRGIGTVLLFGAQAEAMASGYTEAKGKGQVLIMQSREEMEAWVRQHRPPTTLLKASRGMKLDTVVESLVNN